MTSLTKNPQRPT